MTTYLPQTWGDAATGPAFDKHTTASIVVPHWWLQLPPADMDDPLAEQGDSPADIGSMAREAKTINLRFGRSFAPTPFVVAILVLGVAAASVLSILLGPSSWL